MTNLTERGRLVGTLVQTEFAKQSIALEYRGRHMNATYATEAEAALLNHPGGLIQVCGNFTERVTERGVVTGVLTKTSHGRRSAGSQLHGDRPR